MNNYKDFYISKLEVQKQLWIMSNDTYYPRKLDTPYIKKCYNKCIENVLITRDSTELYANLMLILYIYE